MKSKVNKIAKSTVIGIGSILIAGGFWQGETQAVTLYNQTINTGAIVNAGDDWPNDCKGSERCFYKDGQGVENGIAVNGIVFGGLLPDKMSIPFAITQQEKDDIMNNAAGFGRLTVTAARDIGRRQETNDMMGNITYLPATEWLTATSGNVALGDLFKEALSTCKPGENSGLNRDLTCGPNYHTDVTATDFSIQIPKNLFLSLIDNNMMIPIDLDPTDAVGRLKIFSINLQYQTTATTAVPEFSSVISLLAFGTLGIGLTLKRNNRQKLTKKETAKVD